LASEQTTKREHGASTAANALDSRAASPDTEVATVLRMAYMFDRATVASTLHRQLVTEGTRDARSVLLSGEHTSTNPVIHRIESAVEG